MARGLGGLIGVGRVQKEQALAGLTRAAQLETQQETIERTLEAQKKAAQMNVVGTAGGIGTAALLAQGGTTAAGGAAAGGAAAGGAAAGGAAAGGAAAGSSAAGAAATGAGGAAAGGAAAGAAAALPWVALIIGGGYLLKKLFD